MLPHAKQMLSVQIKLHPDENFLQHAKIQLPCFAGQIKMALFSVAEDCSALCSALAEEQLPHEFGRYNVQELDPQALDLSRPTARCLS